MEDRIPLHDALHELSLENYTVGSCSESLIEEERVFQHDKLA